MDEDEEALTIEKFFFPALAKQNHPVYLPLETIQDACHQICPGEDTDTLIDDLLAKAAKDEQ